MIALHAFRSVGVWGNGKGGICWTFATFGLPSVYNEIIWKIQNLSIHQGVDSPYKKAEKENSSLKY